MRRRGAALTAEGFAANAAVLFLDLVHHRDQDAEHKEAAGRFREKRNMVGLEEGNGKSRKRARTEKLAHGCHGKQGKQESSHQGWKARR